MRTGGIMARESGADTEMLQAALMGFEIQRDRIDTLIAGIRAQLGRQSGRGPAEPVATGGRGRPRGRRVAAAGSKPKRKLSAEGRARIVEATKARWEAYRAAKEEKAAKKAR